MINDKCPFTTSYSVQTGVKHSLGASVFTGYLGREGTRAQEGYLHSSPVPRRGAACGRGASGLPAVWNAHEHLAVGRGGPLATSPASPHPGHAATLSEAVRRRKRPSSAQAAGTRRPSLHLLFASKDKAA